MPIRKLAFVFLLPYLCTAADAPPSLDSVLAQARNAPGEFAADSLIRLAGLNSLEKARRIQLLEQAFDRAGEAQEPLKRQSAILKVPGSAAYLNRAYAQNLDALSLRLRVIAALEPLDLAKARDLFARIPPPRLVKLQCADFMVYNIAAYYQALERLAPPRTVQQQAGAILSPVQIVPMAKVIGGAAGDSDFQSQLTAFAGAIRRISGDDRSFTFARDVGPSILSLVEECKRRKISPLPLLESYRVYLVSNEQTARCGDDDLMSPPGEQKVYLGSGLAVTGGEGVDFFNSKLRIAPLQPIQEQETTPTSLEGVAEGLRGCQDTTCQALFEQYKGLIFDPKTGLPYPTSRKGAPDWQDELRKFLAALNAFTAPPAITPAQYYRQKTSMYADTLSLVPAGPLQEEVLNAFLEFVEKSPFKAANHSEWILPVNVLAGRMAMDPLGLGRFAGRLRKSPDAVIALYAALEAVAPRTPDQIMALM